jgi:hypothetical protein
MADGFSRGKLAEAYDMQAREQSQKAAYAAQERAGSMAAVECGPEGLTSALDRLAHVLEMQEGAIGTIRDVLLIGPMAREGLNCDEKPGPQELVPGLCQRTRGLIARVQQNTDDLAGVMDAIARLRG